MIKKIKVEGTIRVANDLRSNLVKRENEPLTIKMVLSLLFNRKKRMKQEVDTRQCHGFINVYQVPKVQRT